MNYELTEDCYSILLKEYNEWSEMYYQLFGEDGIPLKERYPDLSFTCFYDEPGMEAAGYY